MSAGDDHLLALRREKLGVGAAENAGILAAQILALSDAELAERLAGFKAEMTRKVIEKDESLGERLD